MTRSSLALDRPVFVVGPPRSGTTMLRHNLNRHPDLAITPETHLLDVWLPRFGDLARPGDVDAFWAAYAASADFRRSELDADVVRDRVAESGEAGGRAVFAAILASWADQHGASRPGEKTPAHALHLGTLLRWFPDARVLWLQRDPRDTVASELAFTQAWAADRSIVPARHWARIERARPRWQQDERVLVVRYESVVAGPEQALVRILTHLDLDGGVMAPAPAAREGTWHGGHDPAALPTTASVGRWRVRLTPMDAGIVDAVTSRARHAAGYPAVAREVTPAERWAYRRGRIQGPVAAAGQAVSGLVRRVVRALRRRLWSPRDRGSA